MTEAMPSRCRLRIFTKTRLTLSSEVRSISSKLALDGNFFGGLRSSPITLKDAATVESRASPMNPLLPVTITVSRRTTCEPRIYRRKPHRIPLVPAQCRCRRQGGVHNLFRGPQSGALFCEYDVSKTSGLTE